MTTRSLSRLLLATLLLAACSEKHTASVGSSSGSDESTSSSSAPQMPAEADYATIEWTDLLPQDDLDALMNPPEYLDEIEDGSAADEIESQLQSRSAPAEDRYQQALVSTQIRPEYNNRYVRLPGFIVPLEFNDEQVITTFFFVPFFGACIHLPPPPPNQIIYVEYEPGIHLESLYDPFWVAGKLLTQQVENDTATASYSMTAHKITAYVEDVPEAPSQ